MKEPFRADMEMIRRRAREKMDQGAVTEAYRADVDQVIEVLNEVLATEIVCVLRYKNHYFMAPGVHGDAVAGEFLQHATEEQEHADLVARRIAQLGGNPDLDPAGLHTRSHAEYREGDDLEDMIREDLAAERVAIATYSEIIRWLGDDDPTSRRMMEELLAKEEEHADELAMLLEPTRRRAAQAQRQPVAQSGTSQQAAGASGVNRGRGTS
jgi:bacterioferritin